MSDHRFRDFRARSATPSSTMRSMRSRSVSVPTKRSFSPVLTRSTTPRSAPASSRETRTTSVMSMPAMLPRACEGGVNET